MICNNLIFNTHNKIDKYNRPNLIDLLLTIFECEFQLRCFRFFCPFCKLLIRIYTEFLWVILRFLAIRLV